MKSIFAQKELKQVTAFHFFKDKFSSCAAHVRQTFSYLCVGLLSKFLGMLYPKQEWSVSEDAILEKILVQCYIVASVLELLGRC